MVWPVHGRLSWGGTIGSEDKEIWTNSLKFAWLGTPPEVNPPPVDWSPGQPDVWDPLVTFHQLATLAIKQECKLRWVKYALIGTDGKYLLDAWEYTPASPISGSYTGASSVPPQVSIAVTLWSGYKLGKGNYGRFYIPWPANVPVAADGRMTSGTAQAICGYAKTLLEALNTAVKATFSNTGPSLCIVSQVTNPRAAKKVRVGRVMDTQSRRREKLLEDPFVYDLIGT